MRGCYLREVGEAVRLVDDALGLAAATGCEAPGAHVVGVRDAEVVVEAARSGHKHIAVAQVPGRAYAQLRRCRCQRRLAQLTAREEFAHHLPMIAVV